MNSLLPLKSDVELESEYCRHSGPQSQCYGVCVAGTHTSSLLKHYGICRACRLGQPKIYGCIFSFHKPKSVYSVGINESGCL